MWWDHSRAKFANIRRLVIYLDNGPNNSGRCTQFLKRMVQFTDWSGRELRQVYYPPYHSKYNQVERCWSALEQKWKGLLLNCVSYVLEQARRMTGKGHPRDVLTLPKREYPNGVKLARKEMKPWEDRLQRSAALPRYDITIKPAQANPAVK